MFEFFAGIFGYLLELLYSLVNNYGLAIILFTVAIKVILLPLSIKQQKTLKKSAKLQEKMRILQFKYKNNPEKLNQEMMDLYKSENMSPFSGCLTSILQIILLLSVFFLVRCPLTYMEKVPSEDINKYIGQLQEANKITSSAYPEIDIIREHEWIKEKNPDDNNIEKLDIQMMFFGLDLSKVPQQNMTDYTVYIIPILYILSSFISIRMTTAMQEKMDKKSQDKVIEETTTGKELVVEDKNEVDTIMQTNKMMSWMMPIMSISIAFIAPLGLALYWLINNVLMLLERLILNKVLKAEEE